jgi:hypothetical protein
MDANGPQNERESTGPSPPAPPTSTTKPIMQQRKPEPLTLIPLMDPLMTRSQD